MSRLTVAVRRMRGAWNSREATAERRPATRAPAGPSQTPAGPSQARVNPSRVEGRIQCVQLAGYRMYVDLTDELVGANIARGVYEPHVSRAISAALRPGDTFVDLGANIGFYSLLAASLVGPTGHVIGFEARPDNVWLSRLSVRENGFRNVTLHNLAVSDRKSELKMHAPDHTSLSQVVEASVEVAGDSIVIPAVALDDALAHLSRLDVLKMDIDGGELRAFRGMRGLLRRHRPKLFFEFSPYVLRELGRCEPEQLLEDVLALGYRLQAIVPQGGPVPFATAGEIAAHQASLGDPRMHVDLFASCD